MPGSGEAQARIARRHQAEARTQIAQACRGLAAEGRSLNLRNMREVVPAPVLNSVERSFDMLRDLREVALHH